MGDKLLYLQVEISFNGEDDVGHIHWPKSIEELSEFISEEWYGNPLRCLNHFGARGWQYVESKENEGSMFLLFAKSGE